MLLSLGSSSTAPADLDVPVHIGRRGVGLASPLGGDDGRIPARVPRPGAHARAATGRDRPCRPRTRRCSTISTSGRFLFWPELLQPRSRRSAAMTTPRCSTPCGTWSGPAMSPTTRWPRCGPWWAAARRRRARRPPVRPGARPRPGRLARARPTCGGRTVVARRAACSRPAAAHRGHACARAMQLARALRRPDPRGRALAEGIEGGFAGVYPVLKALEERGAVRRGYFVAGLRRRAVRAAGCSRPPAGVPRSGPGPGAPAPTAVVLAATDPAQPFGASLPWPEHGEGGTPGPHRRRARGVGRRLVGSPPRTRWSQRGHVRRGASGPLLCEGSSMPAGTGRWRSARSTVCRCATRRCVRSPTSCGRPGSWRAIGGSSTGVADRPIASDRARGRHAAPHGQPPAARARRPSSLPAHAPPRHRRRAATAGR